MWRWPSTISGSCSANSLSRRAPAATSSWRYGHRFCLSKGKVSHLRDRGNWQLGRRPCQHLRTAGAVIYEVERPRRRERRTGKSDRIDALRAAKRVLSGEGLSTPRARGTRRALQTILAVQRSCVGERTRLLNQLQAICVTAPAGLRERIGPGRGSQLQARVLRMRSRPAADIEERVAPHGAARSRDSCSRHSSRPRAATSASLQSSWASSIPGSWPSPASARSQRQAARSGPRALQARGRLRALQRDGADPGLIWQDGPSPPQPRRGPPAEQRDPHDRSQPLPAPPRDSRLPGAQDRRGQDQARSDALTQAPPLTPPLQTTFRPALDTIEASRRRESG